MPGVSPPGPPLAAPLFDADLAVEEATPAEVRAEEVLSPEELALVASAASKRQREFAAGRQCARRALARLGDPWRPLLRDADGLPRWPAGRIGSISHTRELAVAVVGRSDTIRSVGIDVEGATPLKAALLERVCTPADLGWLATQPSADRLRLAKLVFSAKECAYKAQYPLSRRFLGFHAMRTRVELGAGRFVASFEFDVPPFRQGETIEGRVRIAEGLVLTGCTLR